MLWKRKGKVFGGFLVALLGIRVLWQVALGRCSSACLSTFRRNGASSCSVSRCHFPWTPAVAAFINREHRSQEPGAPTPKTQTGGPKTQDKNRAPQHPRNNPNRSRYKGQSWRFHSKQAAVTRTPQLSQCEVPNSRHLRVNSSAVVTRTVRVARLFGVGQSRDQGRGLVGHTSLLELSDTSRRHLFVATFRGC